MMALWFLSFVDPAGPPGQRFAGACVVRVDASDPRRELMEAIHAAWRGGFNPGGEVAGNRVPPIVAAHTREHWIGRLLTWAECQAWDRETMAALVARRV